MRNNPRKSYPVSWISDPVQARSQQRNLPCVAGLRRLLLPEAGTSEDPEEPVLAEVGPSAGTASFRAELLLARFFL